MKKAFLAAVFVFFCFGAFASSEAMAATYWCNPAGSGTSPYSTKATGATTLWAAMGAMSSGDTLIIANGDWSGNSGMSIDNQGGAAHLPKSGSSYSSMTTIQAETDWGVKLPYLNDIGSPITLGYNIQYVQLQGIVFMNGYSSICAWYHSKLVRCGFYNTDETQSANNGVFVMNTASGQTVGTGCKYCLLEECCAWGGGRYVFMDLFGQHNIFRRCVGRSDFYECNSGWYGQQTVFRGYGSQYTVYQNCIAVDSDRTQYYCTNQAENGTFWVGDNYTGIGEVIQGCIVLKGFGSAYYIAGISTDSPAASASLIDSIALGPMAQPAAATGGNLVDFSAILTNQTALTVTNCTFYNLNASGTMPYFLSGWSGYTASITNSIARVVGAQLDPGSSMDYMYYLTAGSGSWGSHSTNADPLTNGQLYPVRVEAGSALATACNGSRCGANIEYAIGVSGTCQDQSGYNTVTSTYLWPFPNEAAIKTLFSTTVSGVTGAYGFCTGTSKDGSAQTLTKYIWEYLGNQIPSTIYSAGNPPAPPTGLQLQNAP
jgi:hypothetical protein